VQTKNIQLAKTTENNRAVDFSTETTEGLKKQAGGCFLALFQRDNKKQPKQARGCFLTDGLFFNRTLVLYNTYN
jgi:hypothetical protein